ncbi:MAG: hypothetical protein ACP5MD_00525 [Verrucomicrobiia bacterium]
MNDQVGSGSSRRDLLRTALRMALLFTGLLGAAYVTRPKPGGTPCLGTGSCSGCPALPTCDSARVESSKPSPGNQHQ